VSWICARTELTSGCCAPYRFDISALLFANSAYWVRRRAIVSDDSGLGERSGIAALLGEVAEPGRISPLLRRFAVLASTALHSGPRAVDRERNALRHDQIVRGAEVLDRPCRCADSLPERAELPV